MAKEDVRTGMLVDWKSHIEEASQSSPYEIFLGAMEEATKRADWYWHSVGSKRWKALAVRFFIYVSIILGSILPLAAVFYSDSNNKLFLTQLGLIFFALAGLLQLADKIFGLSTGWIRFVVTASALEHARRKFELQCAEHLIRNGVKNQSEIKSELLAIIKTFEAEQQQLQDQETEAWRTEFSNSSAIISDVIKSNKEMNERLNLEIRSNLDKKMESGAVHLTVTENEKSNYPWSVKLGEDEPEPMHGNTWAKAKIPVGIHILSVFDSQSKPLHQMPIVVESGKVANLTF